MVNPNDALVGIILIFVSMGAVAVVLTQIVENIKHVYFKFGPWVLLNTVVCIFSGFNWDLRLMEVLAQGESSLGPWVDNLFSGWVLAGGVGSVYSLGKKFMRFRDQMNDLKVVGKKKEVE